MDNFIVDLKQRSDCKSKEETYSDICIKCNKCGRFDKKKENKKYYIVSNKHTEGYIRTFWKFNNDGYTINLNEAGKYNLDEKYPLITKNNIKDWGEYDTFYIAVEDVELLGKRMICILN